MADTNGWDNYKLLVMESLQRIEEKQETQATSLTDLSQQFVELRTEARAAKYFGNLALPAIISIGVSWIGRKIGL